MPITKFTLSIVALLLTVITCNSQSSNDILVGAGFDLIKTDYNHFGNKLQVGAEANYFVVRHFAAGAGLELWTHHPASFTMGMRYYPLDNFFVRFRGLIGANDVALGGGWAKPINEKLRFEAIGDFYFGQTEFGIRAGIAYVIKNKNGQ
ncbi:MAG TPA: hypothetical protein PKK67_09805 [Cyclobacteriaceae bacterium]|jgi:hypothetical protein|nr:hypothetical protein [Cytophagales bacterium]HNT50870.1 hypothetical protein [Cyclobacteriaceae bacterium]HRE68402.1 hypothetical protein [Cyclobacteriaceae bacterium]